MAAGSACTVVSDRWYLDEIVRREQPRRPAAQRAPALDRREPDPRQALVDAAERHGQPLAALFRMIERPAGYLSRFVREARRAR